MKNQFLFSFLLLILAIQYSATAFAKDTDDSEIRADKFYSSAFSKKQSIQIRLPKSYQNSQRKYPVIYILNANDFYKGQLWQDTLDKVTQLELLEDIPDSIVVAIESDHWYQQTINSVDSMTQFITSELPEYIQSQYRTLPDRLYVAHSYAAAFIIAAWPQFRHKSTQITAVSPVFPDISFIKQIHRNIISANRKDTEMNLYFADESLIDIDFALQGVLRAINQHQFTEENHHSIYTVALHHSLRQFFQDYRLPGPSMVKKQHLTVAAIKSLFDKRAQRYLVPFNSDDIDAAITSFAQDYLDNKQFGLAFNLWQHSQSKFKHYFLNRSASRYLALGDASSAERIWHKLIEYFPDYPFAYHQLEKLALAKNQSKQAQMLREKINSILANAQPDHETVLTQFAYQLVNEDDTARALSFFNKICQLMPRSASAFNNLADGYESAGQLEEALQARKKSVQIAKQQNSSNQIQLQARLDELTRKLKQLESK